MTKATSTYEVSADVSTELYPNLATYVSNGGKLTVKRDGRLWYVTVSKGSSPDLGVTLASSDLAYALQQADGVSKSWVLV